MEESTAYGTDSPTSQPWLLLAISLTFGIGGIIALLTLIARLAIRHFKQGVKLDDYMMLLAWVSSVITQSILVVVASSPRLDLMYIAEAACLLSHGFAQISIALLWLRIIPLNWQMYTGWVIIGVIVIYTLVILGLLIYSGFGDGSTEPIGPIDGTAHSPQLSMAATVASIIAGLMLILIPSLDILGTQMTPTEKRRAILRWCSPVIAILASAVRLFFLTSFPSSPDLTMHAAVAMVLMFAEVNLTIICGNLPATLQTIKRMKSKASSETMAGSGSGRGGRTSHAPRGLDEYPLQSRDETKQPWTGDGDDSSQRGILATHLSTV